MSIALSLFGIFFGLFLLIVLTYKGLHVSWVSILVAILIMVTSGLAITDTWNNAITAGIANIAGTMIPIYVAGATFGKLLSWHRRCRVLCVHHSEAGKELVCPGSPDVCGSADYLHGHSYVLCRHRQLRNSLYPDCYCRQPDE